jgi:hypothetical protein
VCAHRTANQPKRNVLYAQIGELSKRTDSVDLGRPSVNVIQTDKTGVEIHVDILSGPSCVHVLEGSSSQLPSATLPDSDSFSANEGVDRLTRLTDDVPIRKGIRGMTVCDQARAGRYVRYALGLD